ncbi:nucleoside monophosphate kinase [Candidatus Saccharibacteria bacterium]|nr:nucleoside monophosphate kinase [Candidatus Saccharibacteria bacterium]
MDRRKKTKVVKDWLGTGSINIFGAPFAGKDTQGHRLAAELDAPLLGGGDILRGSTMPDHIKKLMRTGKLIPTNDYHEIVLPYFKQKKFEGKPLVLSSVGRWHGEEAGVLEATSESGHPLKAVIYLKISEETVWQRWEQADSRRSRGKRADDTYEALQVRLAEFRDKTLPAIDFYGSQNLLVEIDSEQDTDIVTEEILDSLIRFAGL